MNPWANLVYGAEFTIGLPFGPDATFSNFSEYFTAIVNFAILVAGLIAVLVIVYAGMVYVQSQGQADRVSQAKELIAGALTGLALLLMIRLIVPTLNIGDDRPPAETDPIDSPVGEDESL